MDDDGMVVEDEQAVPPTTDALMIESIISTLIVTSICGCLTRLVLVEVGRMAYDTQAVVFPLIYAQVLGCFIRGLVFSLP